MTAINGRVTRLERSYGVGRSPESEEARLLRRLDEVIGLIPTPALQLLRDGYRASERGELLTPEQHAARVRLDALLATGEWPA
jgi:hypothetical protein